jgi:hypothetical protein
VRKFLPGTYWCPACTFRGQQCVLGSDDGGGAEDLAGGDQPGQVGEQDPADLLGLVGQGRADPVGPTFIRCALPDHLMSVKAYTRRIATASAVVSNGPTWLCS